MIKPIRIQRKRTKGWRMPPNTVYVGRGSKWGNPFRLPDNPRLTGADAVIAVELFDHCAKLPAQKMWRERVRLELRGKNLACWCPLDKPCHADVLLRIANKVPE